MSDDPVSVAVQAAQERLEQARRMWRKPSKPEYSKSGLPYNCAALTEPLKFEPDKWDKQTSEYNNCYNYALNIATGRHSQPGRWKIPGGHQGWPYERATDPLQCEYLAAGAIYDGLTFLGPAWNGDLACSENCHMVALFVHPGKDFHWIRRDQDGTWSHKLGKLQPARITKNQRPITDPTLYPQTDSDSGSRGDFRLCGLFCVCKCQTFPERESDMHRWEDTFR